MSLQHKCNNNQPNPIVPVDNTPVCRLISPPKPGHKWSYKIHSRVPQRKAPAAEICWRLIASTHLPVRLFFSLQSTRQSSQSWTNRPGEPTSACSHISCRGGPFAFIEREPFNASSCNCGHVPSWRGPKSPFVLSPFISPHTLALFPSDTIHPFHIPAR